MGALQQAFTKALQEAITLTTRGYSDKLRNKLPHKLEEVLCYKINEKMNTLSIPNELQCKINTLTNSYYNQLLAYINLQPDNKDFIQNIKKESKEIVNELFSTVHDEKIVTLLSSMMGINEEVNKMAKEENERMKEKETQIERIIFPLSEETAALEAMQGMVKKGKDNPEPALLQHLVKIDDKVYELEKEKANVLSNFNDKKTNEMCGSHSPKPMLLHTSPVMSAAAAATTTSSSEAYVPPHRRRNS